MRLAAVVLALTLLACGRRERELQASQEAALRNTLATVRSAIAKFRDDNGRPPHSLEELIPRYIARVPADPITGSGTTWRLTTEETVRPSEDFTTRAEQREVFVLDVHSTAPGSDSGGKPWSEY
jgi:hypothetical protein